jgi:hypothetical protein
LSSGGHRWTSTQFANDQAGKVDHTNDVSVLSVLQARTGGQEGLRNISAFGEAIFGDWLATYRCPAGMGQVTVRQIRKRKSVQSKKVPFPSRVPNHRSIQPTKRTNQSKKTKPLPGSSCQAANEHLKVRRVFTFFRA